MSDKDLVEAQKRAVIAERDELVRFGSTLVEKTEKDGGFAEYFSEADGLGIEDPVVAAQTAVMMENARKWMKSMDEATLSLTTGGYRDHIYPIIRAAFPNNPINELVSVQPQNRKNGTIYWMNYVIGKTRGSMLRGQTLFDANNGWQGKVGYTDESIAGESSGLAVAAAGQTIQLAEFPVRAGNVEVTIAQGTGIVVRDDGKGLMTLVSAGGTGRTLASGTVNYLTGAIVLTFDMALTAGGVMTSSYGVDLEAQSTLPEIDIEMQSTGVTAVRRPISMRISMESMQDFQAEMGMDVSSLIVQAAAQQLLADTGAEVVRDLWDMAGAAASTFSIAPSTGLGRAEHFRDVNFPINVASGAITDATQRGEATFAIVDQKALNVLKTIGAPQFVPASGMTSKSQGLTFVGTFDGLKVYRYKFLSTFPGAAAEGNILLGYKGDEFWDTGYVWAPYQQLYTNGPDERADLTRRQAWAMRYAKKKINSNMYKRVGLTA